MVLPLLRRDEKGKDGTAREKSWAVPFFRAFVSNVPTYIWDVLYCSEKKIKIQMKRTKKVFHKSKSGLWDTFRGGSLGRSIKVYFWSTTLLGWFGVRIHLKY